MTPQALSMDVWHVAFSKEHLYAWWQKVLAAVDLMTYDRIAGNSFTYYPY